MTAYLQLSDVICRRGKFQLGPLALSMEQRDYLVLLGAVGCGKTTLLRLLSGALGRAEGDIRLDGEDINRWPPHRRRVAYVSQSNDLFPHLTVADNVAFGLRFQRGSAAEKSRQVGKYLDLFGLADKARQPAATLSGGEGKKLAMARSLAVEPRLLLLDEPLGMLDHNERAEVLQTLLRVHAALHTTTIHVTHDRQEAWAVAQRCAVMQSGRIEQIGPVAQVFRQPASRAVAEFLGAVNIFAAADAPALGLVPAGEFMIRPECIRVGPENSRVAAGSGEYRAAGQLDGIRDLGDHVELDIRVGALRLVASTSWTDAAGLCPGTAVRVLWPTTAVHSWK